MGIAELEAMNIRQSQDDNEIRDNDSSLVRRKIEI